MEPLQGHTHVVAERGSAPQAAGRHRVMRFLGLQHPADLNAPSGHYQSVHSPGHFDVVSPGHFDVVQHSADVHTAGRSFGNPARTTDPVATTCIPANPDTSGIGVRAAIHVFVNPADLFMPEFNSARRRSNVAPHLASVQQNANGDDSDLGEFQNAKELEVVLEKRNKVERGHSANALEGASRAGHDAIAQLLDHGAAFNAQDGSFDSALAQPEDARPVRAEALAAWGDPQLLLHKHNLKNHVNGILHLLRAHGANLNAVYARTPPAVDVTVQSQAGVHGPLGNRACAYGY
ncbi:hypothetical protein B0H16DRAFT_114988 [Mycena metata]|uniref:Uncharacterized protein n=1 Tax=Mycena metata TaxID=1033252 RepID=A0AAD7JXR4_9AGAR|nr:hypothetical protein B0H16DRAFT_114988 [Mycena metata]